MPFTPHNAAHLSLSRFFRSALAALFISSFPLAGAGCGQRPTRAPYGAQEGPAAQLLLQSLESALPTLKVSRGKIRESKKVGASIEVLAADQRIAARIHVAGQELVQLGIDESNYTLRVSTDRIGALQPGFYNGPSSTCVLENSLGIQLSPASLSQILRGGGPALSSNNHILGQQWDPKTARELLWLNNDGTPIRLEFSWQNSRWQFSGMAWWPHGSSPQMNTPAAGSLRVEAFHEVSGNQVPKRLRIYRRENSVELVLSLLSVTDAPALARYTQSYDSEASTQTQQEVPKDDWEDGWEDEEGEADGNSPSQVTRSIPPASGASQPKASNHSASSPFHLPSDGLIPRGDFCRQ